MASTGGASTPPGGGPDAFALEAYKQVCDDFRQLNQAFWQAPVIIVSITGGIGLAVATVDSWHLRFGLLILAAACNGAWAAVIVRLRSGVMRHLLAQKREFEDFHLGRTGSDRSDRQIIMWIFVALLVVVAIGCLVSACLVSTLFPKKDDDKKANAQASVSLVAPAQICPATSAAVATRAAGEETRSRQGVRRPTAADRRQGHHANHGTSPIASSRLRPGAAMKCQTMRVDRSSP